MSDDHELKVPLKLSSPDNSEIKGKNTSLATLLSRENLQHQLGDSRLLMVQFASTVGCLITDTSIRGTPP